MNSLSVIGGAFFVFMIRAFWAILFVNFFLSGAKAQFLSDSDSHQFVIEGLDAIYNQEFKKASGILQPVYEKYTGHPVSYLLKATNLFWQYQPIEANPSKTKEYLALLEQCKKTAEKLVENDKYKAEATFYLLSAHGFIARVYHHNRDYIKAGLEAKAAYSYLKDGFELVDQNPDFLFTNGMYLFYREQYPETHPQIKPIIYFFKNGSKVNGLKALNQAGQKALFSKIEAKNYLGGIYLKYENRNAEALRIYQSLVQKYPRNPDFYLRYVQSLVATNDLTKAKKVIENLDLFFGTDQKLGYLLFKGLIAEKSGDFKSAEGYYEKVLAFKGNGGYSDDFLSMAKLGFGRIKLASGNRAEARELLKEALAMAEYNWVKSEAEKLLDKL
jgi:tetratricopeptide (TPR) repeat protein